MGERFVIFGGGAAGMSAAAKARRGDPDLEIVVLEAGEWVAFGACGLPYYVTGEIPNLSDLVVRSPEKLVDRYDIDLRRRQEIVGIDRESKTVTVDDGSNRYELEYGDLLLATGGRGSVPDVSGTDLEGVFTLRSLAAGRSLRDYVRRTDRPDDPAERPPAIGFGSDFREYLHEGVERVAVVGANKIGLELVEAFDELGLDVHLVDDGVHVFEQGPLTLPPFGAAAAGVVEEHLRERGVTLHLDMTVEGFTGAGGRVAAIETDQGRLDVDAVLIDEGVQPNVELAEAAGIELGPTGAIATDEYGRTNDPHVYAAGDCAEKRHAVTGEAIHLPLGLAANRGGRAVGATVAGTPTPVGKVVGTTVMKVFDLEVACSGVLDPETARDAGFEPISETVTSVSRAHYYPGGSRIVVEMVADRDSGRLLGAGLVGREGCAHRINAVATALQAGMSVSELGDLDFGYAPPFGPVWDPLLTAAKVVSGDLDTVNHGNLPSA